MTGDQTAVTLCDKMSKKQEHPISYKRGFIRQVESAD